MGTAKKFVFFVLVAGATGAQASPASAAPDAPPGQPALYVPWPVSAPAATTIPQPIGSLPSVVRPGAGQMVAAMPALVPVIGAVPSVAAPSPAIAVAPLRPVALRAPPAVPESHPGEGVVSHALLSLPGPLPAGLVDAEIARLRAALRREVPGLSVPDDARQQRLIALAQSEWRTSHEVFDHAQLLVVVDRNPRVQQVALVVARPDLPWEVLGAGHVSTGQPGRFDHYITPTGVFLNTADILGYRAEGTYNENHIRGLGVKGMRVWDFGWQTARKGWRADGETGEIRLEMHATDPEVLAQRIGSPASQGCVRIPDALNRFFDRHGVLDAEYERAAIDDVRYRALLLPDRVTTPLAGHALVIVDSSGQT